MIVKTFMVTAATIGMTQYCSQLFSVIIGEFEENIIWMVNRDSKFTVSNCFFFVISRFYPENAGFCLEEKIRIGFVSVFDRFHTIAIARWDCLKSNFFKGLMTPKAILKSFQGHFEPNA